MTIGNHGSGQNCPVWKKVVIGCVAILIFTPLIYKVVKSIPAASTSEQVLATSSKTADR
jgi:hypothetical protein